MVTWFHSAALCVSMMGCHGGIEGSPAQLYLRKVDACRWQLFVSFIFFLQINKVYLRINLIYQTLTVYSVFIRNAPKLNVTFFASVWRSVGVFETRNVCQRPVGVASKSVSSLRQNRPVTPRLSAPVPASRAAPCAG